MWLFWGGYETDMHSGAEHSYILSFASSVAVHLVRIDITKNWFNGRDNCAVTSLKSKSLNLKPVVSGAISSMRKNLQISFQQCLALLDSGPIFQWSLTTNPAKNVNTINGLQDYKVKTCILVYTIVEVFAYFPTWRIKNVKW